MSQVPAGDEDYLPPGWERCLDYDGRAFYLDHNTQSTTWIHPRDRYRKPATFADCVGDELPYGWEQVFHPQLGEIFINHLTRKNQLEDPRVQHLRSEQEQMLKDYLVHAQQDLQAKQEMYHVKQERLHIAHEEVNKLNASLDKWKDSSHSLSSGASTGSKYDPDLLKVDVEHARSRVERLKREIQEIAGEMKYRAFGVQSLSQVEQNLCQTAGHYTVEQAEGILNQINHVQTSLQSGERDRRDLLVDLLHLREEFHSGQRAHSAPDVSVHGLGTALSIPQAAGGPALSLSESEQISTACQTEPEGQDQAWGEVVRMRLQYDEVCQHVAQIKQELNKMNQQIMPGQNLSDHDRLLLIQEKDNLLKELKIKLRSKALTEEGKTEVERRVCELEVDLKEAFQTSNRQIAERLKLNENKSDLLLQLQQATQRASYLENQLKSVSQSLLSISSGSSLGSAGSLASLPASMGSNSSLTLPSDLKYPEVNLPELHRRVERLLQGRFGGYDEGSTPLSTIMEVPHHPNDPGPGGTYWAQHGLPGQQDLLYDPQQLSASQTNVMWPHDHEYNNLPFMLDYNQSTLSSSPRLHTSSQSLHTPLQPILVQNPFISASTPALYAPGHHHQAQLVKSQPVADSQISPRQLGYSFRLTEAAPVDQTLPTQIIPNMQPASAQLSRLELTPDAPSQIPSNPAQPHPNPHHPYKPQPLRQGMDQPNRPPEAPLSPASVASSAGDVPRGPLGVSASASEDSLAADSGISDASVLKFTNDLDDIYDISLEAAQIQVSLSYIMDPGCLSICIERARNLSVLHFTQGSKVFIKAALLPTLEGGLFETKSLSDLHTPKFKDTHLVAVHEGRLKSLTLQLHVWQTMESGKQTCLGACQISLAAFDVTESNTQWYNVLSFEFMMSESSKTARQDSEERDKIKEMLEQSSSRLRRTISQDGQKEGSVAGDARVLMVEEGVRQRHGSRGEPSPISTAGSFKEESSDDSTIISSQTSTLTKNVGYQHMLAYGSPENDDHCDHSDSDSNDSQSESGEQAPPLPARPGEVQAGHSLQRSRFSSSGTNTDSVLLRQSRRMEGSPGKMTGQEGKVIRRSQTFTPNVFKDTSYQCSLNRSDSDSLVRGKRSPFQRHSRERRSVRLKQSVGPQLESAHGSNSTRRSMRTSLDLELDLRSSQSRLLRLKDELTTLRLLKQKMQEVKGSKPSASLEDEQLPALLAAVEKSLQGGKDVEAAVERRADRLLRRGARDAHRQSLTQEEDEEEAAVSEFRKKVAQTIGLSSSGPYNPVISESVPNLQPKTVAAAQVSTQSHASSANHVVSSNNNSQSENSFQTDCAPASCHAIGQNNTDGNTLAIQSSCFKRQLIKTHPATGLTDSVNNNNKSRSSEGISQDFVASARTDAAGRDLKSTNNGYLS